MSPSVEVLIPHWNEADRLAAALESLTAQTRTAGVCVVDNASTDHTPSVLRAHPDVRVVRLQRNLGFGAAMNRGVRSSQADLVVLINNDAIADERFIEGIAQAHERSGAAMVAACLRDPRGRVESLGVEVDQSLVAYDYLHGTRYEGLSGSEAPPLAPCAGAGAYVRKALLEVGGFDEAIFAYLEDVDVGLRMRRAGVDCELAPDAFVWHEHSATLGRRSAAKSELVGWSSRYLLWKYGAALSFQSRMRRRVIDGAVAAGKGLADRNLGMARGWAQARRELSGRDSPLGPDALEGVPLTHMSTRGALARRLARRA